MAGKTGPGSDKPFTWKCKSGAEITMPSMSELDPELGATEALLDAGSDNELMGMAGQIRFLTSSLPPEAAVGLRKLKTSEFQPFMDAWSTHSGVSVGESSAS